VGDLHRREASETDADSTERATAAGEASRPIPIAVALPCSYGCGRLLHTGGRREVLEHLGYVLLQLLLVFLRLFGETIAGNAPPDEGGS